MTYLDRIRTFLPDISDEECELRRQIHACQNAAAWRFANTDSAHARELCSMAGEITHAFKFAPASNDQLLRVVNYCADLIRLAHEVEIIRGEM